MRFILIFCCFGLLPPLTKAQPGSLIRSPEALSGLWEAPDGHGGQIGLALQLITQVQGSPNTFAEVPQHEIQLYFYVYHQFPGFKDAEGNSFRDGPGEGMRWDGHHLRILMRPGFDIDLLLNEQKDEWRGHIYREDFKGEVVLRRPASGKSAASATGTWRRQQFSEITCLHIAQRPDRSPIAWSDTLRAPGLMKYANGIRPPAETIEIYGERQGIVLETTGGAMVTFGEYAGMCCPHGQSLKLSRNGMRMRVDTSATLKRARVDSYERTPTSSCITAPKHPSSPRTPN